MNRTYEELFVLRPDAPEEEVTAVLDQVKAAITNAGGTISKEEKWGVRKLAYRVKKRAEGFYILVEFAAGAQAVREIERRLRVSDSVLKFITVRIDEKMKKIEKRKKHREKRAARKPPVVAAPAMPAEPAAAAPGPAPAMPGAPAPAPAAAPEGTTQE